MILRLFETEGFYYNELCGRTIVVYPSLIKFDKFDGYHITFPIKCDVFQYNNYIFLLPPSKNSRILCFFETPDGVINNIEGECQVFFHYNNDDKIDYALIIAKPDSKVIVDWKEYYQDRYKRWIYNRWISDLIDGEEIPHPIEHRKDTYNTSMAVSC